MDPTANFVVLWGSGLLVANLLFDPIFSGVRDAVTPGSSTKVSDQLNTSPVHMVIVGLITLVIAGFAANSNPRVGKAILAALAGLTVLWLISYQAGKKSGTITPITPTGGK